LRLTNIGAILPPTTAATAANAAIGVLAGIRNIYLYQAGKLIDQRREFNRWAVFHQCFLKSNQTNTNLNRSMYQSEFGFSIDGAQGLVTPAAPDPLPLTDSVSTTCKGVMYLRDVFGFLRAVDWLPNGLAPITLIIEWDMRSQTVDPNGAVDSYLEPVLVADYSDDPKMAAAAEKGLNKDIVFEAQLHDTAYVDEADVTAGNPEPKQRVTIKPRGFDGLTVQRILIAAEPTDGIPDSLGRLASSARWRGTDRFILNGEQKHGYEGLDSDSRRMTTLIDAYGETNALPGIAQPGGVPDQANHISQQTSRLMGNLDYTGAFLGDVVADLQHEWGRTGCFNAGATGTQSEETANRPLSLHYFADVKRTRRANGDIMDM
jgi:hypothetical protein